MSLKTLRYYSSRSMACPVTRVRGKKPVTATVPVCTKEAAVLLTDGQVLPVPMTSYTEAAVVLDPLKDEDVVATFLKSLDHDWAGEVVVPNYEGNSICYWTKGCATLDEAVAAACTLRDEKVAEAAALKADPSRVFAMRLRSHDWWCMMSDDYSVTLAGEADLKNILEMAKQFPVETVRELWVKFAPAEFTCPV